MTLSKVPRGPTGRPFIGQAWDLSRGALEFLRSCARDYGDLVPLQFFWKQIFFVNHPDYIGQVLATNHRKVDKCMARRLDHALLGDGIALSEGDEWRRERRMLQPSFHRERLAAYGELMVALAKRMTDRWQVGETRDICVDLSELSIAIVARTLFGITDASDEAELTRMLADALACRDARVRSLGLLLPERFPTPSSLRLRWARREIDRVVDRLIGERRNADDDRGDLLSTLLIAQHEDRGILTDQQVHNDVLTLLVAGSETVTDLLTWTWYVLSRHPEVETRLLAEIDGALGSRPPTVSDVGRLPYASAIVSEVLRLYPPAPALARAATEDVEIGGYRIERGTEIVVSQWVMQRDPRYFADPDAFDPDRWSDDLASRLPPYAYFPFGAGPRRCIGRSYATMEAVLVLVSVAQRFRLELVPGQRVVADEIPTLHPKFGLRMTVRQRHDAVAPAMASTGRAAR
jgi:cytochrome P450